MYYFLSQTEKLRTNHKFISFVRFDFLMKNFTLFQVGILSAHEKFIINFYLYIDLYTKVPPVKAFL